MCFVVGLEISHRKSCDLVVVYLPYDLWHAQHIGVIEILNKPESAYLHFVVKLFFPGPSEPPGIIQVVVTIFFLNGAEEFLDLLIVFR